MVPLTLSLRTQLVAIALAVLMGMRVGAQEQGPTTFQPAPDDVIESDSDPTRPVFFSIRPEFYDVSDAVERRALIFRYDSAALKKHRILNGMSGAILRLELPISSAYINREQTSGLGDFYGQFFVVPYMKRGFALALGSGFVVPSATEQVLGAGKWVLAPVTAPLWRFPGGLFLVKVQNFTSVAGDASRADLNYLLITPTFIHVVLRNFWVLADSETKTTWTSDGRTGVKSGLQVGARIVPGVGLWIKPEVWWGPNREGQWNVKFGLVWYQGPGAKRT